MPTAISNPNRWWFDAPGILDTSGRVGRVNQNIVGTIEVIAEYWSTEEH
jgi:hypothetical protein